MSVASPINMEGTRKDIRLPTGESVRLEPVVRLYETTGEARYLQLAERIVEQADARPELAIVRRAGAGADAAEIATGKAYQLLWMTVGLVRLHRSNAQAELIA